jgi:hypothetical protein
MISSPAAVPTLSTVDLKTTNLTVYGLLSSSYQNYQTISDAYYVASFGVDTEEPLQLANGRGRNEELPFASIKFAAYQIAKARANGDASPYTIFVRSGSYTEANPIYLPPNTSVIGDNLRRVSIYPQNPTSDIFWVSSACYIWGVTFRGHFAPSYAVSFPLWANYTTMQSNSSVDPTGFTNAYNSPSTIVTPPQSRPYIFVSPYVQGCTSYAQQTYNNLDTGDGNAGGGMLVDGSRVDGVIRSMVLDSFTQVNQGGLGIHLINHGYAQLVSIFTVATTQGILAENGATCSISTSNSTFGLSGLVARGKSTSPILSGVFAGFTPGTNVFTVSGVEPTPIVLPGNDLQYIAKVPYPGTCFYVDGLALSSINPIANSSELNMFACNKPLTITQGVTYSTTPQTITIDNSVNNFINIIQSTGKTPPTSPAGVGAQTGDYLNASRAISAVKPNIQQSVTNWVSVNYPYLSDRSAQTYRDSGFVLDAVIADVANVANHRSVEVGNLFYQGVSLKVPAGLGGTTPIVPLSVVPGLTASLVQMGNTINSYISGSYPTLTATVTNLISTVNYPFSNSGGLLPYNPAGIPATLDKTTAALLTASRTTLQSQVSSYVLEEGYLSTPLLLYICSRDSGKWVDAVANDLATGVNARSIAYAEAYWSGSSSRLPDSIVPDHIEKTVDTLSAFDGFMKDILVQNNSITGVTSTGSPTQTVQIPLDFNIGTNLNKYFGKPVNFYARSTIETGSHTFEYMGCGTNIVRAVPAQGGQVNNDNEVVYDGLQNPYGNAPGIVYYTSSNEKGNFNVGPSFQIVQSTGTITGQTFQRSILTLVTPLTISLE